MTCNDLDPERFPRVLLVGHRLDDTTGGSITLSTLFAGWPRDRLAVAAANLERCAADQHQHGYCLGPEEDRWFFPLSLIRRAGPGSGPVSCVPGRAGNARCAAALPASAPGRLRRGFYSALERLGGQELLRRCPVSPRFLAWVEAFRPDVVYALFSTVTGMRFLNDLLDQTGLPLVSHMMDDWPSTTYRRGLLAPWLAARGRRELASLLARSAACLAICSVMADEYRQRYGREFLAFHNAVDLLVWKARPRVERPRGAPFILQYGGRIGPAVRAGLLDAAEAVKRMRRGGRGIELRLQVSDADAAALRGALGEIDGTTHVPMVPHADVPASLAAADALLLPCDFDPASRAFARLSMPTKTVEYMASGRPVLVYAPPALAVTRYARDQGWGLVVDRRDSDALCNAISALMDDRARAEELTRRAREAVERNHDAAVVRESFRQVLAVAAAGTQGRDVRV